MKERAITLKTHDVRAILDGRKSQARQIIKAVPTIYSFHGWVMSSTCAKDEGKACWAIGDSPLLRDPIRLNCPLGKIGDRLWVRETWQCGLCTKSTLAYKATHKPSDLDEGWHEKIKWRPSTQMPRSASRILLEITAVRVERLQDISEQDAVAEGVDPLHGGYWKHYQPDWTQHQLSARGSFVTLWSSINGVDAWYKNPWVWVVEFKRVTI